MEDSTIQKELYQCVDKAMSIVANQAMEDVESDVPSFDTLIEFEGFFSEERLAEDIYNILYRFYKKQYRWYKMHS